MPSKKWPKSFSHIALVQVFLLCIAAGLPLVQWRYDESYQSTSELRLLRIQRLQLVRALGILRENTDVTQSVGKSAVTVESITLSLIEAIKSHAQTEAVELTQLTVTLGGDQQPLPELHMIRVSFSMLMARAVSLLAFFDIIRNTADWRPIEVRRCSVLRKNYRSARLIASCVVDVYYFPEVDK